MLEQFAEECTELAQAALKQARILRGENPTPVTEVEAHNNVIGEFTDVIQCAMELNLTVNDEQQAMERIGGKHGHKGEEAAMTALKMLSLVKSLKK